MSLPESWRRAYGPRLALESLFLTVLFVFAPSMIAFGIVVLAIHARDVVLGGLRGSRWTPRDPR